MTTYLYLSSVKKATDVILQSIVDGYIIGFHVSSTCMSKRFLKNIFFFKKKIMLKYCSNYKINKLCHAIIKFK